MHVFLIILINACDKTFYMLVARYIELFRLFMFEFICLFFLYYILLYGSDK
jgi:hypothetical protein